MSKTFYEVAAEISQDVFKARAQAISGIEHIPTQEKLISQYLSDAAAVSTYKEILKAVNER